MENDILTRLTERARPLSRSVVLPDSLDVRTLRAAVALHSAGAVRPVLVGPASKISDVARRGDIDITGVEVVDPATSEHRRRIEAEFAALGDGRVMPDHLPAAALTDPLVFAGMMVRCGLADGSVAGCASKTADVIRAALRTIGMRPGVGRVSGYFLMVFSDRIMAFADCAVQPDPGPAELAEIAGLTADNFSMITGTEPVVAFLSFSTKGSAPHPASLRVSEAAAIFGGSRPEITSDGEMQFDAAVDPGVAKLKSPDSPVAGRANVLVFPDLNSGNIGYKIAQRLGGAQAIGPILQGLARPAFDLSRGCSVGEIVMVSLVNALSSV